MSPRISSQGKLASSDAIRRSTRLLEQITAQSTLGENNELLSLDELPLLQSVVVLAELQHARIHVWQCQQLQRLEIGLLEVAQHRRVKCDEAKPTCAACQKSGLLCDGYQKSIFFDFDDVPEGETQRYRRPLLTEEERLQMSVHLTDAVPPRLAFWFITQIDEDCTETSIADEIVRGPFSAFRLSKAVEPPAIQSPDLQQETSFLDGIFDSTFDLLSQPNGLDHEHEDLGRVEEVFDDDQTVTSAASLEPFTFPLSPMPGRLGLDQVPIFRTLSPISQLLSQSRPPPQLSLPKTSVPDDAVMLLKHYSTVVLKLLTPYRHSKTPWHVLFLPQARHCLAALALGEVLDCASICTFYSILSISAFSIGGLSKSEIWMSRAQAHRTKALEYVHAMLATAYEEPKRAKYKSILMALLAMIQLSVLTGDRRTTEQFLLEAELFIRVKGLNRRKSRKVRLLHHCYVFERLLHESTVVNAWKSSKRRLVNRAIQLSGAVAYSLDGLDFRLSPSANVVQEMMTVKNQETGENDLHLQKPGVWQASLYPEIFGVPEPYLLILSLTIRLKREREYAESSDETDALPLKSFTTRAKEIERGLKILPELLKSSSMFTDIPTEHSPEGVTDMLEAMRNALEIYFYRASYNIDASMLQTQVRGVYDALSRLAVLADSGFGSVRLIWPAFVAACNAEGRERREDFARWFRDGYCRSGLSCFSDTLTTIESVWSRDMRVGAGGEQVARDCIE